MGGLFAIAVFFVLLVVALKIYLTYGNNIDDHMSGNPGRKNKKTIEEEAEEIAAGINTYSQIKNLEKRCERADEKRMGYDFKTERAEENHERKYEVLSEAFDIASEKHLRFYYLPDYDINTPLEKLNRINKIVPIEKFDEIRNDPDFREKDWVGMDFYEEPEELDEDIIFFKKIRRIVENDKLSKEEMIKKINKLVAKNKDISEEFFDLDSDKSAGEQFFKNNNQEKSSENLSN